MARDLPLVEQVTSAANMALRTFIHLGLWRLTAGKEGRERHKNVLDDHWEHIRFLEHGQLFVAVVELHSLLDADKATINIPNLINEVELKFGDQSALREAYDNIRPSFEKLRILRNSVYAHRTRRKSYADMFKLAKITPDELKNISETCIKICNELKVQLGLSPDAPSTLPTETYDAMLRQLSR